MVLSGSPLIQFPPLFKAIAAPRRLRALFASQVEWLQQGNEMSGIIAAKKRGDFHRRCAEIYSRQKRRRGLLRGYLVCFQCDAAVLNFAAPEDEELSETPAVKAVFVACA
jgi:hypothetical protein